MILVFICCFFVSTFAEPVQEQWWTDDGLIDTVQAQDLRQPADPERRCALLSLWLPSDSLATLCPSGDRTQERPASHGAAEWTWHHDSSGVPRYDRWSAQWRNQSLQAHVRHQFQGRWQGLLRWKSGGPTVSLGDLGASESGPDPLSPPARGVRLDAPWKPCGAGVLVAGPERGGVQGFCLIGTAKANAEAWTYEGDGVYRLGWEQKQGDQEKWSAYTVRTGNWSRSFNRWSFRQRLWPQWTFAGSGFARTGSGSIPLVDLPASWQDVRLWLRHEQEWQNGSWKWSVQENAVRRNLSDSVTLAIGGERRRHAARLAGEAACRAVRTECGLPRMGLRAGVRVVEGDSLSGEARWQAAQNHALPWRPAFRIGWQHRLAPGVVLDHGLDTPDSYYAGKPFGVRQMATLTGQGRTQLSLALRASYVWSGRGLPRPRLAGGELSARW